MRMQKVLSESDVGALLWVLWHHQGGSSPVGQPIRRVLGIGQHARLTDAQVAQAKQWGQANATGLAVGRDLDIDDGA